MTTIITVTGVDAADNSIGFAPPVSSGLRAWFHLGTDAASTVRNRAPGGSAGTITGSPTYSAGYMSSTGVANRLNTSLVDVNDCTLLVVARSSADFTGSTTRPNLIGTFASQSSGIAGASIYVTGTPSAAPAATLAMSASRDAAGVPTQNAASITVADFSDWTFLAGTAAAGATTAARAIYDKTNGVSATSTPATGRLLNTGSVVSIANFTSLTQGQCDVAWAAFYNVVLTEAAIDKIYAFVARRLLDKFSITI